MKTTWPLYWMHLATWHQSKFDLRTAWPYPSLHMNDPALCNPAGWTFRYVNIGDRPGFLIFISLAINVVTELWFGANTRTQGTNFFKPA